jgi:hypothetical protein
MIRSAEFGFLDEQIAQAALRNHQDFDRSSRHSIDQRRSARQLGEFSHERARPVAHDQFGVAVADPLHDVDLAGQQDKGPRRDLAGAENARAGWIGSALAKPADTANLRQRQHREHLGIPGVDRGLCSRSHGPQCGFGCRSVERGL